MICTPKNGKFVTERYSITNKYNILSLNAYEQCNVSSTNKFQHSRCSCEKRFDVVSECKSIIEKNAKVTRYYANVASAFIIRKFKDRDKVKILYITLVASIYFNGIRLEYVNNNDDIEKHINAIKSKL